jgi:hypothetical protein
MILIKALRSYDNQGEQATYNRRHYEYGIDRVQYDVLIYSDALTHVLNTERIVCVCTFTTFKFYRQISCAKVTVGGSRIESSLPWCFLLTFHLL